LPIKDSFIAKIGYETSVVDLGIIADSFVGLLLGKH
jgi:hypothetical protein